MISLLFPAFSYPICLPSLIRIRPFIAVFSPSSGSNGKRQPIRVFLSNESGYYLDMCVYKEVTNHVTGQTVFHAYGTKQGPWHGNWNVESFCLIHFIQRFYLLNHFAIQSIIPSTISSLFRSFICIISFCLVCIIIPNITPHTRAIIYILHSIEIEQAC